MNYTPLFENIVQEYGITCAAIHGSVWRYCQQNGTCYASVEAIGARVGVKPRATINQLKTLVDAELLIDLTPDLRNRPHTYKINGMHLMHSTMHLMHTRYASNAHEDRKKIENNNGSTSQEKRDMVLR